MTIQPTDPSMFHMQSQLNRVKNLSQRTDEKGMFSRTLQQAVQQHEDMKTKEARIPKSEKQHMRKVAEDMEAIFVNMMFKSMRKTLNPSNNLFHGGFSEEAFQDMMYEKIAETSAKQHDFGIANPIYREMILRY